MEFAASAYLPQRTINRQRLSRDELKVLREDAENLRARIASALAVHINVKNKGPHSYPQPGVDRDMLDATRDFFVKLAHTLHRHSVSRAPMSGGSGPSAKPRSTAFTTNKTRFFLFWVSRTILSPTIRKVAQS
jgi:hypothetical protein